MVLTHLEATGALFGLGRHNATPGKLTRALFLRTVTTINADFRARAGTGNHITQNVNQKNESHTAGE